METALYIIFFLSCVILVVSVLLQPGKTDAGALFTSGVSSASMNPRGTASVLSKLTIVMATTFMLSALMLSLPALTGNRSVLDTQGAENPQTTAPVTNPNSNNNSANTSDNKTNNNSAATNSSTENKTSEAESNTNK